MNQTYTQRMAIRAYRDALEQQRIDEATRAARVDFLAAMAVIAITPAVFVLGEWIVSNVGRF